MAYIIVHGNQELRTSLEAQFGAQGFQVCSFSNTEIAMRASAHIAEYAEDIPEPIRASTQLCIAYKSKSACSDTFLCGGNFPDIPSSLSTFLQSVDSKSELEIPYEKLRELFDEVVSIAHHDFSEPARNIAFFAELLEQKSLSPDREADFLARTKTASQRLQALIRDLTRYARVWLRPAEETELQTEEIRAIVEEAYERATQRPSLDKSIGIKIEAKATLRIPPRFLARIAEELIANGLEHHQNQNKAIHFIVEPAENSSMARLEVIDDGPGIMIPSGVSLFRPFYRNERNDELRTGIGLALVKALCERVGGSVHLLELPESSTAKLCLILPTSSS